jgi:protein-tyrosine sulfotransferase
MQGDNKRPPIFLGGCGRSGTTLLRVMLDSHPHIACGPEFKLIPSIANLWDHSVTGFLPVLQGYDLSKDDISTAYRHFIEELLSKYLRASGKARIAEKSPNNVFYFPQLAQIFPDSPLIHVIRDGRDVVSSLLTMDWVSIATGKKFPYVESAQAAADYWKKSVTAGRRSANHPAVKGRYYELRYEDLVRQPDATLRALFEFIDEPWDPAVLEYHRVERNLAEESSASQVSQSLYSKAIGRWQTDLSTEDKATVQRIAGDLLLELGYA